MVNTSRHQLHISRLIILISRVISRVFTISGRSASQITHIGTWIAYTSTITTTEYIIYNICTLDEHLCTRHSSAIATAIHLSDTGQVTTLDNHFGTLLRICRCRHIVRSITTAIHSLHIIADGINIVLCSLHRRLLRLIIYSPTCSVADIVIKTGF